MLIHPQRLHERLVQVQRSAAKHTMHHRHWALDDVLLTLLALIMCEIYKSIEFAAGVN